MPRTELNVVMKERVRREQKEAECEEIGQNKRKKR